MRSPPLLGRTRPAAAGAAIRAKRLGRQVQDAGGAARQGDVACTATSGGPEYSRELTDREREKWVASFPIDAG